MKTLRKAVCGVCVLAVLAAVGVWVATGARVWTRYPSENIQQVQQDDEGGLDDLFADAGLNDDLGELEAIDNDFRFGLLPSGPGREVLSVASVGGLAFAASLLAWWFTRKKTPKPTPE